MPSFTADEIGYDNFLWVGMTDYPGEPGAGRHQHHCIAKVNGYARLFKGVRRHQLSSLWVEILDVDMFKGLTWEIETYGRGIKVPMWEPSPEIMQDAPFPVKAYLFALRF